MSLGEGDGCLEDLTDYDTRGCVENLNDNYYYVRLEVTDYVYSAQEPYYKAHEDAYQTEKLRWCILSRGG